MKIKLLFLVASIFIIFVRSETNASVIPTNHPEYKNIVESLQSYIEAKYDGTHYARDFRVEVSRSRAKVDFMLILPAYAQIPASPMKAKMKKEDGIWHVLKLNSGQPWYVRMFGYK
jgi:hypothetical protein